MSKVAPETLIVEAPLCFSRNDMTPAARKERKKAAKARVKRATSPRENKLGPTPERMAKGDVEQGKTGQFLVVDAMDRLRDARALPASQANAILDRLHKRVTLDTDPGMNDRMYEAGRKYERVAHAAGMSGVAAQNLLSCGGGGGDPASAMPGSTYVAQQRETLRRAWSIMGTKVATAVHAMLVEGQDAEAVGRMVGTFSRRDMSISAASTALRIGLSQLVEARWA